MNRSFSHGVVIVVSALLLALMTSPVAAKRAKGKMEGNVYVAPIGDYRCEIPHYDPRDVKIDDGFGPAGGTSAFKSFFDITRVDVEEIEGGVRPGDLEEGPVRELLTYYFNERVVPLVRSGIKDATVISKEFVAGPVMTYRSVMKLPLPKRSGGEMLRGAIQYTNGNFMYVVSVSRSTKSDLGWSQAKDVDELMKQTELAFSLCHFPAPSSTPTTTEPSA